MKLNDLLYQKPVDSLKALAGFLEGCYGLSRKEALVQCIREAMTDPVRLRQAWERLDNLAQKAVAAAYYNAGSFDSGAFVAQYGRLPTRPQGRQPWQPSPAIPLDLFIYGLHQQFYPQTQPFIPADLLPLLAELVPPQDKFQLEGVTATPKTVRTVDRNVLALHCAETEQTGLHDLTAYLHLAAQGELKVTYTGDDTNPASMRKVVDSLLEGDFFPLPEKYRSNQTIRPYGLDVFARTAGLVEYPGRGGQLQLTDTGRAFYQTGDPEVLLEAFITWTETGKYDELKRISAIKGQRAGATHLTPPHTRREAVIEALSWCPAGVWLKIEDFYRALKIWHFDFKVETSPSRSLYIGQKEYGLLYSDTYWFVVKGSYINVVLWEYLGSIGALDLLYTPPELSDFKLHAQNLYYDAPYISPYDGLKYFRINPLGAYLLGQAREYKPTRPREQTIYAVSAGGEVTITRPELLTPLDQSQLALMAVPVNKNRYRLDVQQLLSSIEAGNDWRHLLDYLSSHHEGSLPQEVQAWFARLEQNSQFFKTGGDALFIKVKQAELIAMVMADPVLQKFTHQIDARTLVIPANRERAFRNRLKELEYLLL